MNLEEVKMKIQILDNRVERIVNQPFNERTEEARQNLVDRLMDEREEWVQERIRLEKELTDRSRTSYEIVKGVNK